MKASRIKPTSGWQRAPEVRRPRHNDGMMQPGASSPIFGNDHIHKANYLAADANGRVEDLGIDYPTALAIATRVYESEERAHTRELELHCCL